MELDNPEAGTGAGDDAGRAAVASDTRCVWIPGIVEASEFLGEFTRYRVRAGAHSFAVDQAHHAGMSTVPAGRAVSIGLDPSQVRLIST